MRSFRWSEGNEVYLPLIDAEHRALFGLADGLQNAVVAGDVAMLQREVQPVLKALRSNGLDVVAIHHHMIDTQPVIIFLHYWGKGPADKLASGFKAALDQLGKK